MIYLNKNYFYFRQNIDALNILMNNLIDFGKVSRAHSIAKYFKYMNQDLRRI